MEFFKFVSQFIAHAFSRYVLLPIYLFARRRIYLLQICPKLLCVDTKTCLLILILFIISIMFMCNV
jgi:hypothetical protein